MVSRRNVIFGAGGVLALVGAGATWRVKRAPNTAYLPWSASAEAETDPRLDAFRHAILAPNPHNMQPWLIRLIGTDRVDIFCDLAKRLPQTDPFDRQIIIGFGCFVELARIAATRRGFTVEIEPFPAGAGEPRLDARPIARLHFKPAQGMAPDPLAAVIRDRRSAKVPYQLDRPVPAESLVQLRALSSDLVRVEHAGGEAEMAPLRAMANAAFELELKTPRTLKESIDVLRIGAQEIDANPDGIALRGPFFEALSLLGPESIRRDSLDPQATANRQQVESHAALVRQTPTFIWLTTTGNTRAHQLAAGQCYLRLNLATTALGLGLHPLSQALQEYPEMTGHFAEAKRLCRVHAGETLQMLARLGYATPVAPTPRWPLEAKLIRA